MLGVKLDTRVRRTVGVTVSAGLAPTVSEESSAYFPARVERPSRPNSEREGSPRVVLGPYTLWWAASAPVTLAPCDRIEVPGDTIYELLAKPESVRNGRRTLGYRASALPIADLYPRSAELKALGAEATIATVPCAVFSERESRTGRGQYSETFAEAPSIAWAAIDGVDSNAALHFADGSVWRITEATLAPEIPFVSMAVRKQG